MKIVKGFIDLKKLKWGSSFNGRTRGCGSLYKDSIPLLPPKYKELLIERRICSPAMVQEGGRCETEIILSSFWRSGRVVECGGLENRWA